MTWRNNTRRPNKLTDHRRCLQSSTGFYKTTSYVELTAHGHVTKCMTSCRHTHMPLLSHL